MLKNFEYRAPNANASALPVPGNSLGLTKREFVAALMLQSCVRQGLPEDDAAITAIRHADNLLYALAETPFGHAQYGKRE